ncbi:hypothetical protein INT45_008340, partial [Circinella minor]
MSDTIHNKIFKFISAPGTFSGTKRGENPTVWLGEIKRLWQRGNFTDDEVLLIAGSNLKGQAGLWWNSLEDSILTWDAFEEAFRTRFISAEHREAWWSEIEAIKQQDNESVENVAYKLQELFDLVGPVDEIFQIRYFTQAIDPKIAYRMEESGVSTSWKQAVNKAIRIQNAQKKYLSSQELTQGQDVKNQVGASVGIPQSAVSSSIKPEDSVSQTNTLLSQVAESLKALQLQLNSQTTRGPTPPNYPPRPPPRCWHCGEVGKWQRTTVKGDTVVPNNYSPGNSNSARRPSHQSKVNLVQTAEVYAVGGRKRGASDTSLVSNIHGRKRQNESYKLPLLNQQVVTASSSRNLPGLAPQQEGVSSKTINKQNKTPRKRPTQRKLQVDLEKSDVWNKLKEIDSGLSMAQWLALDKQAYADVRDGLKFLHGRNTVNKSGQTMDVNALEIDSNDSIQETDWESTWSEASSH